MKTNLKNLIFLCLSFLLLSACTTNTSPTAKFSANQTSGTPETVFTFDASASSDPDGSIESYQWDFGDGSTATGQTASHQFKAQGTYTVKLTVKDDGDSMDSSSLDISVSANAQDINKIAVNTYEANKALYEKALEDEASQAVGRLANQGNVGGFVAALLRSPENAAGTLEQMAQLADEPSEVFELPRGTYEWNDQMYTWELVAESSEFILRDQTDPPIEINIDWDVASPTQVLSNPYGGTIETPTDLLASMTLGGKEAARLAVKASWYDSECGPILEPTRLSISGFFGIETKESFDITATLTDNLGAADSLSSKGFFKVAFGEDSSQLSWDITATGELKRTPRTASHYPCFLEDVRIDEVKLSFESAYQLGQNKVSFGVDVTAKPIYQKGYFTALNIKGDLVINGTPAANVAGVLDDENFNGIPGENVTVTYSDGSQESLEQFLKRNFVTAALRSLVRANR